jgi:hypothetical protein
VVLNFKLGIEIPAGVKAFAAISQVPVEAVIAVIPVRVIFPVVVRLLAPIAIVQALEAALVTTAQAAGAVRVTVPDVVLA